MAQQKEEEFNLARFVKSFVTGGLLAIGAITGFLTLKKTEKPQVLPKVGSAIVTEEPPYKVRDVEPPDAEATAKPQPSGSDASSMPTVRIEFVERIIDDIIDREGGGKYTNRRNDRGGPTRWGVTLKTLSAWRNKDCTPYDVDCLEREEAESIFRKNYYFSPRINELPEWLQPQIFDMSVLHGPESSVKLLQKTLNSLADSCGMGGCKEDGVIGQETMGMLSSMCDRLGVKEVNNALVIERAKYCKKIIDTRESQKKYEKGWLIRVESFRIEEAEAPRGR